MMKPTHPPIKMGASSTSRSTNGTNQIAYLENISDFNIDAAHV